MGEQQRASREGQEDIVDPGFLEHLRKRQNPGKYGPAKPDRRQPLYDRPGDSAPAQEKEPQQPGEHGEVTIRILDGSENGGIRAQDEQP